MIDYHPADRRTIIGMMARYMDYWNQRAQQTAIREAADREINSINAKLQQCWAGLGGLGIDISAETAWTELVAEFGKEVTEFIEKARVMQAASTIDGEVNAAEVAEDIEVADAATPVQPEKGRIKDVVLGCLKACGEAGMKAADIRTQVEAIQGREIHWKTTGMTLFRLKKDGLVRRDGHMWFFVPPKAETENPGGGTPGSVVDLFGKEAA